MKFICPKCETKENFVEMSLDEETGKHVCPECETELAVNEAEELFENGEIVAVVESNEELDETTNEDSEASIEISEDIEAFKGVCEKLELSEEATEKAISIFEAAVTTSAKELAEQLAEEKATEYRNELFETVSDYLDYAVSEWVEENKVALEKGIKAKMDEELSDGIAKLLENHYFKAPEDRWDVVEGLVSRVEELETKLDEQIEKTMEAKRELFENQKKAVFDEMVEGLAETDKERVEKLAENIKANDIEKFREALETIVESFATTNNSSEANQVDEEEGSDDTNEPNVENNVILEAARLLSRRG